jgi:hypothetical protein
VHTAWPAAGTAHTLDQFLVSSHDPARPSFDEFGPLYPADPFVAGKRGNVVPEDKRTGMGEQSLP